MKENKGRRPNSLERRVIFDEAIKEINASNEYGLDKHGRPIGGFTGSGSAQNFQGTDNPKPGVSGSQDRQNRFDAASKDRDDKAAEDAKPSTNEKIVQENDRLLNQ
jgi:hypothetical protein